MRKCKNCNIEIEKTKRSKYFCGMDCWKKFSSSLKNPLNMLYKCFYCHKEFIDNIKRRNEQSKIGKICCSHKCKGKIMKEGKAGYGFKRIYEGKNPKKYIMKQENYIRKYEHRKIMEGHLGRRLKKSEFIHHINGDTQDNRVENLMIVNSRTHGKIEFQMNDRIYKSA